MENTEPKNVCYVIFSKNTNLFLIGKNVEERKITEIEEHFIKHPILALIFYGLGSVVFGFVLTLTLLGAVFGIPLIIAGLIMIPAGIIEAINRIIVNKKYGNDQAKIP